MLVRVETGRTGTRKMAEEGLAPALATDNICQDLRLFEAENHHRGRTPDAMRKRRPRLLVCGFAVYHDGVATRSQLRTALPHLLDKRAGRIVGVRVNTTRGQRFLDLQSRTKGRYNHDIFRGEFVPWDQLLTGRGENKPYPTLLQVPVDIGIVDHLTEEKHAAVGMSFQRSIGNIHRVLDAETEAKVAGQNKAYGTEIEHGREQIPLAWVLHLPRLFDARDHWTCVKNRDIKLSCHSTFYPYTSAPFLCLILPGHCGAVGATAGDYRPGAGKKLSLYPSRHITDPLLVLRVETPWVAPVAVLIHGPPSIAEVGLQNRQALLQLLTAVESGPLAIEFFLQEVTFQAYGALHQLLQTASLVPQQTLHFLDEVQNNA